jgi:hypothetical protein
MHPEAMSAWVGTGQDAPSMTIPLWNSPAIADTEYVYASVAFIVPSAGTYYVGFHAESPPAMRRLYLDDVNLLVPESDLDLRIGFVKELFEDGTPTYSPDDTVMSMVYVKNTGTSTPIINERFFIGIDVHDSELEFEIVGPLGDTLDILVVYSEQSGPEVQDFAPIYPDSIAVKTTNLWEWYLLDDLGDYTVKAIYRNYSDPGGVGAWMGRLVTDPIVIRIE